MQIDLTDPEVITAIGSIATPILLLIFGGIGASYRNHMDKKNQMEAERREKEQKLAEAMREERLVIYNQVMEPFVLIMTKNKEGSDLATIFSSKQYVHAVLKFNIFASDEAVQAHNQLRKYAYASVGQNSPENAKQFMDLLGNLFLQIRKDSGNEQTNLDSKSMFVGLLKD